MKYILTIILIINAVIVYSQSESNDLLIYVNVGDKYGYINFQGDVVVPVEFDRIHRFSENVTAVFKGKIYDEKLDGKWGYWTREGIELIPPQYDDAKDYSDGLAPVGINGKYGFINLENEIVIPDQFDDAEPFEEGLAAVKVGNWWGFIDTTGRMVISPKFDRVENFDQGHAVVFVRTDEDEYKDDEFIFFEEPGYYGMIDSTGSVVLDTIYHYIDNFKNGYAVIERNRKQGLINTSGEIIIPTEYDKVEGYSEGLVAVGNYMMRESYFNFGYTKKQIDSLRRKVDAIYDSLDDFDEIDNHPTVQEYEQAKLQEPSEKLTFGYIDIGNNIVIDFQFNQAAKFYNGLAVVEFGQTPGMYFTRTDKDGTELPAYHEQVGIGFNLIDKEGKLKFDKNQRLVVRSDSMIKTNNYEGTRIYDGTLQLIFEGRFKNCKYIGSGIFLTEDNSGQKRFRLSDETTISLGENFYDADFAYKNYILVRSIIERDGRKVETKAGIIDLNGNWIVRPKYDFATIEWRKYTIY